MSQMKIKNEKLIICLLYIFFPIAGISTFLAINYVYTLGKFTFTIYLLFVVCVLLVSRNKKFVTVPIKCSCYPLLLILLLSFGFIRTYFYDPQLVGLPSSIIFVINCLAIYYIAKIMATEYEAIPLDKIILSSYIYFFLFNCMLFVLGVRSAATEGQYSREMETIFSFLPSRQVLPLSVGLIDSSIICLIAGVSALFLYQQNAINTKLKLLYKAYYLAVLLMTIIMMAISGGRTAIAILFLVFIFAMIRLENKKKTFLFVAMLAFFFPLIYLPLVFPLYTRGGLEFLEFFSRTGDVSEVILLNNRVLIWASTLIHLYENFNPLKLLFGYGFFGQTISGAVYEYNFIFSAAYSSNDTVNVHSSLLQILINYGILGVIIYCAVSFKSLFYLLSDAKYKIILYILLTSFFATMMEAQLAVDSYLLMLFLLFTSYAFVLKNKQLQSISKI